MIYITGDTHGDFTRIRDFCKKNETTTKDIMIILGDAGINYSGYRNDLNKKRFINRIPITLFCIHGNHEQRPQHIEQYKKHQFMGGKVYREDDFPTINFAIDGEIYYINGIKTMVCGGAYSVDKFYRIQNGWRWFEDEQPDDKIKFKVQNKLADNNWQIDVFLSHTTPYNYRPTEMFLPQIDQKLVDSSTELWLQTIEDQLDYKHWYCGHYHTDKTVKTKKTSHLSILFNDIIKYTVDNCRYDLNGKNDK